jgi:hypothetical protein
MENESYETARDVYVIYAADGTSRVIDLNRDFYALDHPATLLLDRVLGKPQRTFTTPEMSDGDVRAFTEELLTKRLIRPKTAARQEVPDALSILQRLYHRMIAAPILALCRHFPAGSPLQVSLLLFSAYLSVRTIGSGNTVRLWGRSAGSKRSGKKGRDFDAMRISDQVRARAARSLLPLDCKERALTAWIVLRFAGANSKFNIGITLYPFAGHCWCSLGDCIVADDEERCKTFTSLFDLI